MQDLTVLILSKELKHMYPYVFEGGREYRKHSAVERRLASVYCKEKRALSKEYDGFRKFHRCSFRKRAFEDKYYNVKRTLYHCLGIV